MLTFPVFPLKNIVTSLANVLLPEKFILVSALPAWKKAKTPTKKVTLKIKWNLLCSNIKRFIKTITKTASCDSRKMLKFWLLELKAETQQKTKNNIYPKKI